MNSGTWHSLSTVSLLLLLVLDSFQWGCADFSQASTKEEQYDAQLQKAAADSQLEFGSFSIEKFYLAKTQVENNVWVFEHTTQSANNELWMWGFALVGEQWWLMQCNLKVKSLGQQWWWWWWLAIHLCCLLLSTFKHSELNWRKRICFENMLRRKPGRLNCSSTEPNRLWILLFSFCILFITIYVFLFHVWLSKI